MSGARLFTSQIANISPRHTQHLKIEVSVRRSFLVPVLSQPNVCWKRAEQAQNPNCVGGDLVYTGLKRSMRSVSLISRRDSGCRTCIFYIMISETRTCEFESQSLIAVFITWLPSSVISNQALKSEIFFCKSIWLFKRHASNILTWGLLSTSRSLLLQHTSQMIVANQFGFLRDCGHG